MMETGPYNADEVAHVKKCAPMLPEPGAYIASRLLDTIDALVKERDEERRNHNHYGQLWLDVRRERDAATARADKAEKDRDDARALLREAKEHVESVTLRERIDDALNRKHAERGPEPEGREGGDGDAIKAFKAVKCFKAGGVMVHVDPDAPPGSMNVVPPGYICPQCGRDDEGIWRGT